MLLRHQLDQMNIYAIEPSTVRKKPQFKQRHDKVILQHDDSRPYVAKPVKTYMEMLIWSVSAIPLA